MGFRFPKPSEVTDSHEQRVLITLATIRLAGQARTGKRDFGFGGAVVVDVALLRTSTCFPQAPEEILVGSSVGRCTLWKPIPLQHVGLVLTPMLVF